MDLQKFLNRQNHEISLPMGGVQSVTYCSDETRRAMKNLKYSTPPISGTANLGNHLPNSSEVVFTFKEALEVPDVQGLVFGL